MPKVKMTGGDTMNLWINISRPQLTETLKEVDILLINDGEAKLLAGDTSLARAARKVLAMGPRALVIKHGEYGATIFFPEGAHPFRAPALPIEEVQDPTGAGDSFAGGFMGYIASQGKLDRPTLTKAMFYGSVMGSFRGRALRHRTAAEPESRRHQAALQSLPQTYASGLGRYYGWPTQASFAWVGQLSRTRMNKRLDTSVQCNYPAQANNGLEWGTRRQLSRRLRSDTALVCGLACVASVASFLWFYLHGQILLYGDAVAHISIARRVVDSRTPGPLQLGTVWLPLPHLLTLPFIINDWLWRSGVGGSIVSMLAYVLAVAGIFRLVRNNASRFLPQQTQGRRLLGTPRFATWLAAGLLALNPNLLYMQATAMTETLFLAELIWAVVYFDEFARAIHIGQQGADEEHAGAAKSLERCAMMLAAAMLTRYDGWALALVIGCASLVVALRWMRMSGASRTARRKVLRSLAASALLCALMPALWLAHNYALDGKPLDWLNGPYSAKAIDRRIPGEPPHPGTNNIKVSAFYFVKAAKLNFSQGRWQGWMMALAVFGTLAAVFVPVKPADRSGQPITVLLPHALLMLWFPLLFYAYAIAYGSVPIFVPVWYPFSHYNVRYGLELLPAFAVFAALAVAFVCKLSDRPTGQLFPRSAPKDWAQDLGSPKQHNRRVLTTIIATVLVLILAANYLKTANATPICLGEARTNSADRLRLQSQLAETLRRLPPSSTLMMSAGEYVGALQAADVHLRRVVSQPSERTAIVWDAGLSCPAQVADYVVAISGDPVAQAVERNPRWLEEIATFGAKPQVTIYRSRFPGRRIVSNF